MDLEIKPTISVRQLKRAFPDLEALFLKIGRSEIARAINSMPKTVNSSLGIISRVAGLTEIEINLLVAELNERNDEGKVKKRILPKVRFKGATRTTKHKAKK
jgi:hypothetical protein